MYASAEDYKAILDGAMDAVYVTDLNYELLYANRPAQEFGKRLFHTTQVRGKCYQVLLGRDSPCPFCKLAQMTRDEYLVRTFQGATGRMFELHGRLIDWAGQPAHIEYIHNITQQQEAIQQSQLLTAQQHDLYEHLGVGMCLYSVQGSTLRPILCNDQYRRLFVLPTGFDEGKPIRLELRNFCEIDRKSTIELAMQKLQKGEPFQTVCKVQDPETGLPRSVLLKADCAPQQDGSTLWYITAFDVTQWVEQETRLNSVLRGFNGGLAVYQVHPDGPVKRLMYTDGLWAMQGYSRQEYEAIGAKDALSTVYPEDQERLRSEILAAAKANKSISAAYRIRRRGKAPLWVNLSASPLGLDAQGCMRYTAVLTNVSYQFELYQELLNLSENGLIVTDRETHEVYFTNETAKRILSSAQACCPERPNCSQPAACGHVLCAACGLQPGREGLFRQVTVGGRVYQVGTHPMYWMDRPAVAQYFADISEETALRQRMLADEERYRLVVEQSGMGLLDYDLKNNALYINERFRQYTGMNEEAMRRYLEHKISSSLVCQEDLPLLEHFCATLEQQDHAAVRLRLQTPDGRFRWTELGALNVRSSGGLLTRKIAFLRDVDDAVRQYEDLKARYDYELARQSSFEGGVVERMLLDLTEDRILRAASPTHPLLPQLVGLRVEELLAARLARAKDPEERAALSGFMDRNVLLQAYYTMDTPTLDMRAPVPGTGERRYFRSTAQLARNPGNGHIVAFIETRDNDQLMMESILMRRLLETNYESALVVHAETGRIKIGWKKGDAHFTTDIEADYDTLAQADIRASVLPEEREQALQELSLANIRAQLRTGRLCSGKAARLPARRPVRQMWTAAYFLPDDQYILITIANITAVYQRDLEHAKLLKKALENAEIASKAKSTFLARMSHEIRTPITTVSGILELIRQDCAQDQLAVPTLLERVDTAATANQYLLTLINDILDISKIENDELTLSPAPTDFRRVSETLLAMAQPLAERKAIRLVCDQSLPGDSWYDMDGVRVSQICMNLLSNAIKFTPRGGSVHFCSTIQNQPDGSALLKCVVQDTGVGIGRSFRSQVFEPFKQEYAASRSGYGGTGIGLAISRSLARLMGGDITFESTVGRGTTFTATMLLKPVPPQPAATPADSSVAPQLQGLHILLCEDNQVNQLIAKQLLERQGCRVTTADDGQLGLEQFSAAPPHTFDCVLMDIQMPVLDGLEAARAIRALPRPDAARVPILAMSANAYEEDRQRSLQAGMNDHLCKPVDPNQLYHAIAWQVQAARAQESAEPRQN